MMYIRHIYWNFFEDLFKDIVEKLAENLFEDFAEYPTNESTMCR